MSAFIVSDKQIQEIINCYSLVTGKKSLTDLQDLANILKRENIRSINYRYNERTKFKPCVYIAGNPEYSVKQCVQFCNCLEYQSCERPDYEKSKAYITLLQIKISLLESIVKTYDDKSLVWSI